MRTERTFLASIVTTTRSVGAAADTVIGLVTLASTVVVWWRFGPSWGITALAFAAFALVTLTGLRLQAKLDGYASLPAVAARWRRTLRWFQQEGQRVKDRRGDDPVLIQYLEHLALEWENMQRDLRAAGLADLGQPLERLLTFDNLTIMERTQLPVVLDSALAALEDLATRSG